MPSGDASNTSEMRLIMNPFFDFLQYQFANDSCQFYCSVMFAREFEEFRQTVVGPPAWFIQSLSTCKRYHRMLEIE